MQRCELNASQRRKIEGFLPGPDQIGQGNRKGNPRFREWCFMGAAQRRSLETLASEYDNWKSAHKRFTRWVRAGSGSESSRCCWQTQEHYVMIDSAVVRARQQAVCGKTGATRLWCAP